MNLSELDEWGWALRKARGFHSNIAKDVCAGKTFRLDCDCGIGREISEDDFATYLAKGWPKCCGKTMKMSEVGGGGKS